MISVVVDEKIRDWLLQNKRKVRRFPIIGERIALGPRWRMDGEEKLFFLPSENDEEFTGWLKKHYPEAFL